jgi:hypothetical protein
MESREWSILADVTLEFIVTAREKGFATDILDDLQRRLFKESPFPIHKEVMKNGKTSIISGNFRNGKQRKGKHLDTGKVSRKGA